MGGVGTDSTSLDKNVVIFKSGDRYESFVSELERVGATITKLDFADPDWMDFDYSGIDVIIYYPNFQLSSNHPQSLRWVSDNLLFLHNKYPALSIYPDPELIPYYSDKYRQYLFLKDNGYPIPQTIPVETVAAVDEVIDSLGFPLVLKNRYGAGGRYVAFAKSRNEVIGPLQNANLKFDSWQSAKHLLSSVFRREFLAGFRGRYSAEYPFWSAPVLAQQFVKHDHDLKVVVGDGVAVEAHWRRQTDASMKKMNIDGGGLGEWSFVPEEAINLCVDLANELNAKWLNVDLLPTDDGFLISEFSPVWHHYSFKEQENFVYKDDYNLCQPLEHYLNLEKIIVASYLGQ